MANRKERAIALLAAYGFVAGVLGTKLADEYIAADSSRDLLIALGTLTTFLLGFAGGAYYLLSTAAAPTSAWRPLEVILLLGLPTISVAVTLSAFMRT